MDLKPINNPNKPINTTNKTINYENRPNKNTRIFQKIDIKLKEINFFQ